MDQHLINLVLALALVAIIHNAIEIMNMREKLRRLTAYMNKKSYKELPISIDTRAKSYGISLVFFVIMTLPLWIILNLIDLDQALSLELTAGVLIANFFTTAIIIDQWHVDIEKITKPFMHTKKK